jgi:hypothetical protein
MPIWRSDDGTERPLRDWTEEIDRLLHAGEDVEEEVRVGTSRVVVTNQRLIALTPDTPEENFRYIDRPNAVGVEKRSGGNTNVLGIGGTLGATGVLSIMVGVAMPDLGSLVSLPDASGAGAPGLGFAESVISLMGLIDTAFMALGALLIANGLVVFGYYLMTRETVLAVEVAGDEDMEFPVPGDEDADEARGEVRDAIAP